jgi:tetratricopeptide (TPR) repeat protein
MNHTRLFLPALLAACCAMTCTAVAQPQLSLPQPSPAAGVSQTIGIAEVKVSYHRPAVKNRVVWGALVPYGEVWRAGANENTTVMFSKTVKVGGKDVPSGIYGLHMIPTKTEWTVILNKNATSWGSYFYRETEDVLRITVAPQPGEFHEWLQYEFSNLTDSSAVLSLCWEKLRIPIPLAVDTRSQVLAHARDEFLRGPAGFRWQGFDQAAQYALRNGGDLNEALKWANKSTDIAQTFTNLHTKASILDAMGKREEAAPLYAKAMKMAATEAEVNTLGYALMGENKMKEALEMFEKNVKDYPDSWNVYDSLAEGLEKTGDVKGAIQNYEKALKRVTDDTNKNRITATIQKLRSN